MNFAYDIIDLRGRENPNDIAVVWSSEDGFELNISNGDLSHHSDVAAYYFRRMGIMEGSKVFLYDLEGIFEFAVVLTALHKLYAIPVFDLQKRVLERCNELGAYAIIARNSSDIIPIVDANIQHFKSLEIKISIGYPYPNNWFDMHTGARLARTFSPTKNPPDEYTSLIVFDDHKSVYDKTYPFITTDSNLWDKFYQSMKENRPFIF